MRLLRSTKTSPQYGFARSASLTSADSVCNDLRKSTGCAASTTLRSDLSAITGCPEAPTAPSKALPWGRCHLWRRRMRRRQAARLARRHRTALTGDPDRHEAWRVNACCRRELVPPHREQPADNAIAPSDLGNIGPFLEAVRYDSCLLFRRPPPPPALSRDQLDTAIRTAFLPSSPPRGGGLVPVTVHPTLRYRGQVTMSVSIPSGCPFALFRPAAMRQ